MNNIKYPNHIAIIVDGNGRWAQKQGMSRSMGHKHGFDRLEEIINYTSTKDIKVISLYVFSTENFKRSKDEVEYLMNLFKTKFKLMSNKLNKKDIKIVFSGRREPLDEEVLKMIDEVTEKTKDNKGLIVNFCMNYGSHAEITDTFIKLAKKIENKKMTTEDINEEIIKQNLYQNLPDIDFLIRTSGEVRLSNFMLYQAAYAELYFPEVAFPDFTKQEFDKAIDKYNNRDRRFGGINYENKNN